MTMRTEKQLRTEFANKGLESEHIDLLVKAEKEAGRLAAETDEDDDEDDEGAAWDRAGADIAKARREAEDELAKAASLKTDVYAVVDQFGGLGGYDDPEQRPATARMTLDPDIDTITPDEVLRDIAKAASDAVEPQFRSLAKAVAKMVSVGNAAVVERLEKRISAQDKLIGVLASQNEIIAKAARKQSKRMVDLQKALDVTPAARVPRYTVESVKPLARPGEPTQRGASVDSDSLSAWIGDEMDRVAKSATGGDERRRLEVLNQALADLDAGLNPDTIAKAVGFKS